MDKVIKEEQVIAPELYMIVRFIKRLWYMVRVIIVAISKKLSKYVFLIHHVNSIYHELHKLPQPVPFFRSRHVSAVRRCIFECKRITGRAAT
jgi:hypothetical protein